MRGDGLGNKRYIVNHKGKPPCGLLSYKEGEKKSDLACCFYDLLK
jgi:hypothetical protein